MNRGHNSMCSMFVNLGSLYAIQRSLFGLHTLEPTMFPMMCSFGSMNKPMFICIVLGCTWGYLCGRICQRGGCIAM